ncbi:hypothetical protein BSKO_05622 [Bryopsis sp. KO-2023]|nr:hypothetical protein BSKO_05622 [Bryopsis sp. KO-2023]
MSRSRRRTLDYFDDLLMSSDDVTRQRHLRFGSESTVSSSGGEPWEDPHYIKCQQQCQTSGFRSSARRPEVLHESFGNNPSQIENDEGSGVGSGSGSGSGSHRRHLGSQSHRGSVRSQTKPLQEYFGSHQGSGWGYSLASPERYETTATVREQQRRKMDQAQAGNPDPFEDSEPEYWSQESQGGEAGSTVESISLRINKAYQHIAAPAARVPISPFAVHQENERQYQQSRSKPLQNNRHSRQSHRNPSSSDIYTTHQRVESRDFGGAGVSRKGGPVVKNNELFEYSLMPRIMPNSGEDQIGDFHKACLDSQPQSNCRTSLTLNSWLGETIDPTFTMESFALSAQDNARLSSGSLEFDVTDQRPRTATSEVASMGSVGSWENEDMFAVSKSEKRSAGVKPMRRFLDMDEVRTESSRNASKSNLAVRTPEEPPNDCTITCRPKTSKKKMVKALRSFICGRRAKKSLEKSWTDRDLKDLVAAQSGTGAIRPSLDRDRVMDSSSREESSQDSEILDTPRGHRGERYFIPEVNPPKQRSVQIVSKPGTPESNPRITEIKWKEMEPPHFQLSNGEWAKYWKFNGHWVLDPEMSDAQTVRQASGPRQKAANKIHSVVIDSTPRVCRMAFLSDALQVQEQMPWGGEIVNCERRDRQMGYMLAWVERTRKGFITRMDWGDPCPAHLAESFELSKDGQLLFSIQEIERRDKPEARSRTRSVYRRQG